MEKELCSKDPFEIEISCKMVLSTKKVMHTIEYVGFWVHKMAGDWDQMISNAKLSLFCCSSHHQMYQKWLIHVVSIDRQVSQTQISAGHIKHSGLQTPTERLSAKHDSWCGDNTFSKSPKLQSQLGNA